MTEFIKSCGSSKREMITYIVVLLWIYLGIFASYFGTDFTTLAAYFISLTGFIGTYIFAESKRKSCSTGIFKKGKSSRREIMIYIVVVIWATVGSWVIYNQGDLVGASAYFAALTPFVGSYILGETFKSDKDTSAEVKQINS